MRTVLSLRACSARLLVASPVARRRAVSVAVRRRGCASASAAFEDVLLQCNNLNGLAHSLWPRVVRAGDTVVDATAGNGHDCLALARLALADGAPGRLLALDLQAAAVASTRARLTAELSEAQLARCDLRRCCHSELATFTTPASVRLVCFNLGYLPGGDSDKLLITQPDTTTTALHAASLALLPGGLLSVMCYTGHPGGREEAQAVHAFFAELPPREWTSTELRLVNRDAAPHLMLAYRRA